MDSALLLARCTRCGAHGHPAGAYGCSRCGAPAALLQAVPLPQVPRLLNWVTVHAQLVPGLPVPCLVGEVELAAGVVEEVLLDLDAHEARPGMALVAVGGGQDGWRFRAAEAA